MPIRRILVALAVPVAVVTSIVLAAGAATGTTVAPSAIPSDQVPQNPATEVNPGDGGATGGGTGTYQPPTTPTYTPTYTPSYSYSPTPSLTPKATGTTPRPPGGAPGGAGPVNCAGKKATPPITIKLGTAGGRNDVLVDQDGCALYLFTKDTTSASACDTACEATWPPVPAPGKSGATAVDQNHIKAFTRSDNKSQVTYFDHQLYYYVLDKAPGDAKGEGNSQTWWLVNKDGQPVQ